MDRPTPDSIAAAKAAQRAEREAVYQQTGVRIRDDGSVMREATVTDDGRREARSPHPQR